MSAWTPELAEDIFGLSTRSITIPSRSKSIFPDFPLSYSSANLTTIFFTLPFLLLYASSAFRTSLNPTSPTTSYSIGFSCPLPRSFSSCGMKAAISAVTFRWCSSPDLPIAPSVTRWILMPSTGSIGTLCFHERGSQIWYVRTYQSLVVEKYLGFAFGSPCLARAAIPVSAPKALASKTLENLPSVMREISFSWSSRGRRWL